MSAEGHLNADVNESFAAPVVGVSDVENEAGVPAIGVAGVGMDAAGSEDVAEQENVAEEVDDGAAEADSNMGRGKSDR